jgi:hypothetical protein
MSVGSPVSEVYGVARPLFTSGNYPCSVSVVAVVGIACRVQVCWGLIWFLGSGFYFVTGSRAARRH